MPETGWTDTMFQELPWNRTGSRRDVWEMIRKGVETGKSPKKEHTYLAKNYL